VEAQKLFWHTINYSKNVTTVSQFEAKKQEVVTKHKSAIDEENSKR
jgi:hypothetical protein